MRRHGFTLIEILLAMAIFTVLLALTGTLVVQTLRAGEYLETAGADQRLASALLDRIGSDVRSSILLGTDDPPNFTASAPSPSGGFGQDVRLDLVTLADAQPDEQGRSADSCEAGWLCRTQDGMRWSLYRREQAMVDAHPTQGGELLLLTDRLAGFTLRYTRDGQAWKDSWDSHQEGRLPWAVKVSFTLLPAPDARPEGPPQAYERILFLDRWGLLPAGQ